jgi:hypothetical protein
MNAIEQAEGAKPIQASEPVQFGDSLLQVIAAAARDPKVDIDKMERLLQMQERVQDKEAEQAFNVALNAAQKEMRPIAANASNPQTRSKYATFDQLDKRLRPIYTDNGFSLSFDEADSPKDQHVRVVCYVSHVAGHTRTYHRDMPADGKGAKGGDVMTKTHAAGAAGSYGARYLLKGIFNVAVGEDDEDGNDVLPVINDDEVARLKKLIEATSSNVPLLMQACGLAKSTKVEALTLAGYERCKDALESKLARMAKKKSNG